jgi:3-deoxy-D-manno-octulosonic-acid transferase
LLPDATESPLDILLGDSLGEMYFYLELCDLAIVGGGFCPKGSHNISEPICLKKPVIIGPNDSTIEFPAREAIEAGLCEKLDFAALANRLTRSPTTPADARNIDRFSSQNTAGRPKKRLQPSHVF